jgi:hypothetical protein
MVSSIIAGFLLLRDAARAQERRRPATVGLAIG